MLKFFRRSKTKNGSNNKNNDAKKSNSLEENKKSVIVVVPAATTSTASTTIPQEKLKSNNKRNACVSHTENVVINKDQENFIFKRNHVDHNTDNKFTSSQSQITPSELDTSNVFVRNANANYKNDDDGDDDDRNHQQNNQNQFQFPLNTNSCRANIYNSKECKKNKIVTISRNEIVDQKQCDTIENVPSKRSINIDRSTSDQQNKFEKDIQQSSDQSKARRQKAFNPINKSREFIYDFIMAKGRNRNRNRNNGTNVQGNNNKYGGNKQQQQQQQQQQDHQKDIKKIHENNHQNKELNSKEIEANENNLNKKVINSVNEQEKEKLVENSNIFQSEKNNFQSGISYQITKSKNSTNLAMKYEDEEDNDSDDHVEHENDDNELLLNTDNTKISPSISNDHENLLNLDDCAGANGVNVCKNSLHLNSSPTQFIYNEQNTEEQQQNEKTMTDFAQNQNNKNDIGALNNENIETISHNLDNKNEFLQEDNANHSSNSEENTENNVESNVEGSTEITCSSSNSEIDLMENAYKDDDCDDNNDGDDDDDNDDHKEEILQHPQNSDDQFLDQFSRGEVEKISELTECDRDRYIKTEMGQTNGKSNNFRDCEDVHQLQKHNSLPNLFSGDHRENIIGDKNKLQNSNGIVIPTITIADYSTDTDHHQAINYCDDNELDTEIFYDSTQTPFLSFHDKHNNKNKQTLSPSMIPTTVTDADRDTVDIVDLGHNEDDDIDDDENDEWHFVGNYDSEHVTIEDDNDPFNDHNNINNKSVNNKNNDIIRNCSENNDDLVISFSSVSATTTTTTTTTDKQTDLQDSGIGKSISRILLIDSIQLDSSDNNNQFNCNHKDSDQDQNREERQHNNYLDAHSINFDNIVDSEGYVRGNSTDCDDNFLQSDYETFFDDNNQIQSDNQHQKQQHHILIDSISLPDVVVESTGMGSSQSIPIKVENLNANNNNNNNGPVNTVEDHHHHHQKTTNTINHKISNSTTSTTILTDHNDNEKRNLVNQEASFNTHLEEAQKIAYAAQSKVNDLQIKIDNLEKELSIKSWNVDRLQAELKAALKEDEYVRKKLKIVEDEKENLRQKFSETEEDLNNRYEQLKDQYQQLQEKYDQIKIVTNSLKAQLAFVQSDAQQCRADKQKLQEEKDNEVKALQEALEKSQEDKKTLEAKWQKEFELLRTQNADQEEHLLSDCEWKIRTMQKTCKEKIEKAESERKEALEKAEEIERLAKNEMNEVGHLKSYEAEVRQLRGLTSEQRESINSMAQQIEDLRYEIENLNQQLEEQIEMVRKIRLQSENALSDKDRQVIQKIDEVRGEISQQWESKLLTEMTRLKCELEIVSVEDRQDLIQMLQAEHVEEIKALTTRYNANEQELRDELESLREKLTKRDNELKELKLKSEKELLQSRLHLEKADRDYQCAMNREEDKKEQLIEKLRLEFNKEKEEIEEKFRERLGQVKDEFAKELSSATEEMANQHRKQLEQQWEQLIAEKEEALQSMESRHRIRLEDSESKIRNLEIDHQRDIKDIKNNYEIERTTLGQRDLQNSQEIEQLHRKCRCLTNLFEEMRMRYERRDPRPEDLREIAELRSRCEAQERDLHLLTERLREIQMELQEQQQQSTSSTKKMKTIRKPPPKNIPISCDVIYEENEENESSPPPSSPLSTSLYSELESKDDSSNDGSHDHHHHHHDQHELIINENGKTTTTMTTIPKTISTETTNITYENSTATVES